MDLAYIAPSLNFHANQLKVSWQLQLKIFTCSKNKCSRYCCAGLAGKELEACKDGASHKSNSKYCEDSYTEPDKINACKQGQSAKIEAPAEGDGEEEKNSCGIDGIGWLVCPVMNFVASLNDAAYSAISGFFRYKTSNT